MTTARTVTLKPRLRTQSYTHPKILDNLKCQGTLITQGGKALVTSSYHPPTPSSGQAMENYRKGKNVQEELSKEKIPIPDLPNNFLWMQVSGGSKIRNLLDVALKGFVEHGAVVWTGSGAAISKTISCAEILKRRHKAYQITKIGYRKSEEFWEPVLPELDELVVERDEPIIHILLSKDPLSSEELGYQAPGEIHQSFKMEYEKPYVPKNQNPRHRNTPYSSGSTGSTQNKRGNQPKKQYHGKGQS